MCSLRQTFDCPVCYCHDKIRPASMGAKMRKAGWFCRAFIVKSEAIRTHKRPKANGSDMKQKKCKAKGCGVVFSPARSFQCWCSPDCAVLIARAKKEQAETKKRHAERKADRERLQELKPKTYWADRAQRQVNRYVRARDKGKPCISCNTPWRPDFQAGHWFTTKAHPELRYDLDNINSQCITCNHHKSGNAAEYRINLVGRIGLERVDALESFRPAQRLTRQDYQSIEAQFKELADQLEKEQG